MNRIASTILPVCVAVLACLALLTMSCKSSGPAAANIHAPDSSPIIGKQWRLAKETIAADNQEDYAAGAVALRSLDAFGTMEVSKLFYHHQLQMVPAHTLVAGVGPDEKGPTKIRVLDGPESGKTLWLYPESAEKMGFPAATPTP